METGSLTTEAAEVAPARAALYYYKRSKRAAVAEANPEAAPAELVQMMEQAFEALSEEERAPFEEKAAADLTRYEEEMHAAGRGDEAVLLAWPESGGRTNVTVDGSDGSGITALMAAAATSPPPSLPDLPLELLVRIVLCLGHSPVDIARTVAVSRLFHESVAEGLRLRAQGCGYELPAAAAGLGGLCFAAMQLEARLPQHRGGMLAASAYHSIFIDAEGRLSTCGKSVPYATDGTFCDSLLGHGAGVTQLSTPTLLLSTLGGERAVSVSAKSSHSLALTASGCVWSWGHGAYGRLGHGDELEQLLPKKIEAFAGQRVIAVSAGARHSLAITDDGVAWSWGAGNSGALGGGDRHGRLVPEKIEALADERAVAVSAGCLHSLVITDDGENSPLDRRWRPRGDVWSFGSGLDGNLGHGDRKPRCSPQMIEALKGQGVVAVSAGILHSLAITADGTAWSWGTNDDGKLGHDDTDRRLRPERIRKALFDGQEVVAVSAGADHTLAITADGVAWSCGSGQMDWDAGTDDGCNCLGHGDLTTHQKPKKIETLAGRRIVAVSAGQDHSLALAADGALWSWGMEIECDERLQTGAYGRLGQGEIETNQLLPVQIEGFACGRIVSIVPRATTFATINPTLLPDLEKGNLASLHSPLAGWTRGAALTAQLDRRLETGRHTGTLLTYAARQGQADAVRLLLESRASVGSTTGTGNSALHIACDAEHLEIVALLSDTGVAINQARDDGRTPLHIACEKGHLESARLLCAARADVNLATDFGDAPLHVTCEPDIIRLLVGAGASINQARDGGWTPLHIACEMGHLESARVLCAARADVTIAADSGDTPLHTACEFGHPEIARLLVATGAAIDDQTTDEGFTPLHYACYQDQPAVMLFLLQAGADASMRESDGRTALQLAKEKGHAECERALVAAAREAKRGEIEARLERAVAERAAAERVEAERAAEGAAAALLAEEEAEKCPEEKKAKKKNKKKKGKGGGGGAAGPSQVPEVAAEEALTAEHDALVAEEDAELAAALEESARLEDERRVAEEQGSSSSAAAAPAPRDEEEPPDDFICPITTELMIDPVMAADGHAYERTAIERWLATKSTSPMTGEALEHTFLSPSHMVRRQIREWQQAHPGQ